MTRATISTNKGTKILFGSADGNIEAGNLNDINISKLLLLHHFHSFPTSDCKTGHFF